jgi:hypothetical protein
MIRKRIGVLSALLILLTMGAFAQSASRLKINEVMIKNTNNYQDDYGKQSPWIEIFNPAYATVNIGGCYLSNDRADLKKYFIPKSDALTKIKARQHIVFWADNLPTRGTFHLNFGLDTAKVNTLYLVSSNGKDIIDSVSVSWNGDAQTSYGRCSDGLDVVQDEKSGKYESAWKTLYIVTPGADNAITTDVANLENLTKEFPNGIGNTVKTTGVTNEKLKGNDPDGLGMSLTAISTVLLALLLLYVIFKVVGNISIGQKRKHYMKTQGIDNREEADMLAKDSGEIYAAIAMALYEHQFEDEVHDWEETKLTIDKVAKTYSPWSSKIYGLREIPNKK